MTMGYTGENHATKEAMVVTADGEELGKVKEIVGDCFKVDARMAPDYWLGSDTISSQTDGVLTLNLRMEDLGEAKQDAPDHGGYHRH